MSIIGVESSTNWGLRLGNRTHPLVQFTTLKIETSIVDSCDIAKPVFLTMYPSTVHWLLCLNNTGNTGVWTHIKNSSECCIFFLNSLGRRWKSISFWRVGRLADSLDWVRSSVPGFAHFLPTHILTLDEEMVLKPACIIDQSINLCSEII